jgi:hypothetical protein
MPSKRPPLHDPESDSAIGLAGGPQPSPPGVSDQTPEVHPAQPEPLTPADAQRRAEEVAHRSGAARDEEVPERREQPLPEH